MIKLQYACLRLTNIDANFVYLFHWISERMRDIDGNETQELTLTPVLLLLRKRGKQTSCSVPTDELMNITRVTDI
jgi:hypothetical protein